LEIEVKMNVHEAIEEIDNMIDRLAEDGIRLRHKETEALYILETMATAHKDDLKEILKEIIRES
jgi:hypothetical protein